MVNIVFMGTPHFAVETLKQIISSGFFVSSVVTTPDKPAGRGLKLQPSPVKTFALEHNIPVLQPEKLSDESFVSKIKELNPDIIVVVAFRKLPQSVWSIPKLGTFNVHTSLLPQYRGAAPINHAIMNGETKTGISTFLLDEQIDTGKILLQKEVEITNTDTFLEVHDKLMFLGAECAIATINMLIGNDYKAIDQSKIEIKDGILHPAPKIHKEDCKIDWNNNVVKIYNQIRGLSPIPAAYTEITNSKGELLSIKIFHSEYKICPNENNNPLGSIISDGKKFLGIQASNGVIYITDLQLAGKKRMQIEDFLRGTKIS
ncbi:methionyl-tRNA formyltransferase [Bacteroidales bacterium OttesenSCG-928-K03]|nr:methionyl-tRNA formyltransferase [Odoribacter sp. OttesenSCG-928-L07]MDL2240459.1 methionyl-tRNA formyltransferase [Bacteroidales bacterium OttesenSCG-928-K22]MDL2243010.1 methionyl-tRNA formyltransferase [Bacteroidales bacterium OttesenSCG-928-K03]